MTHPAEPVNELLQCYDDQGNPTEARTRAEVKQLPPRWWYGVAYIWLVNDAGEIMCSKRSPELSGNPGKWQTYFGGHVGAGHSFQETAQRELAEEAGISRPREDFFPILQGRKDDKHVFFESFAVRFDGQPSDLHFADHEVTEAKWMSMEAYMHDLAQHPEHWCNSCPPEAQEKIRAWLEQR